jgi:uncharacterized membrane protein YwzB
MTIIASFIVIIIIITLWRLQLPKTKKLTKERHHWQCKKLRNFHCSPTDYNNASKKIR